MSRTTAMRFFSVIPITFSIAACTAQAPAEQAEAPVEPTENRGVDATPLIEDDSARAAAEQTKATGWCSAKEPVIFSCQLKSRKVASVCGTEDGEGIKEAQYRFGTLGKSPELVWPAATGKDRLTFSSVPYSGGGEAQLSFSRGDVTYVVYSRMVRTNFKAGEPNYPEMSDGVMVLKGKQTVSDLVCADPDVVPVNYDLASEYAIQSDEVFIIPGE